MMGSGIEDNAWSLPDLNALSGQASGWLLGEAAGINDNGWIVGYGRNPAGQSHAFLLRPVPEPSTAVLATAGALVLLASAWWRRRRVR
jgi:probable HAF family extracellular repeat protein